MSEDKKLQNLQKVLLNPRVNDPLNQLKPNLDGFSKNSADSQLKMKLGQNSFGNNKSNMKPVKDPKGINKQVLKGNAKARK